MFGASFFGKSYFGGEYWGPNVEVIVVVTPKKGTSHLGGSRNLDAYNIRRKILPKAAFEADRQKHLDQLIREDEEIIQIIVRAIKAGII